MQFIGKGIIF